MRARLPLAKFCFRDISITRIKYRDKTRGIRATSPREILPVGYPTDIFAVQVLAFGENTMQGSVTSSFIWGVKDGTEGHSFKENFKNGYTLQNIQILRRDSSMFQVCFGIFWKLIYNN